MGKVRVYELAKELGINSKKLITVLRELHIEVKNHMSTMDKEEAKRVVDTLTKGEKTPAKSETKGKTEKNAAIVDKKKSESSGGKTAAAGKAGARKKKPVKVSRKARKAARAAQEKKAIPEEVLYLEGRVTVGELAGRLNVQTSEILGKLLEMGIISNINQPIDEDTLAILSEEYDTKFELKPDPAEEELLILDESEEGEQLRSRPPVVTVLGHVDHGKTSLLDSIRQTNVIASEAGGITQHIGACMVDVDAKRIVFLDTPGHEAFTAMRARGAQVTDIAVLVVAADDGVMPQTIEAINHVKAAGVPIIVAINKTDKPSANVDRVKQQLSEAGLIPEEWGGDTICVPVSALRGEGLSDLLEMILLVAEMAELKADYARPAKGTVIEGKLDKGRGPVATVLIQDGVMKIGDPIICGTIYGRIRALLDDKGKRINKADPSTPVEILGLSDVPQAGDNFMVVRDEKLVRQLAVKRGEKLREATLRKAQKVSLDDLFNQAQEDEIDLNIIIKADVQGSAEALRDSLQKIEDEKVRIKVIHTGVGAIAESDIMLASASNAIVIGFNVRPEPSARKLAEKEEVDIRLYRVIYEIIENVKAAINGMLEPEYKEVVLGQAEIRHLFKVSRLGTVAGSYVLEGTIKRNAGIRVIRDGKVIHEGKIESLKRFKDDVKEVTSGFECGILLENFNDLKEVDILEAFLFQEVPQA
ncbi:MAG TPA: translation initiation factor IF-2 [Firmicutes bacterium]|jgi:translation initiation factor IF-2|nr:translation initiation factor IF-2 [Bacillota bacterium]